MTSERRLIAAAHRGPAKSTLTEAARLTPRDNEGEKDPQSQAKVLTTQKAADDTTSRKARLTSSSTGKKQLQLTKHSYHLSQPSYMNDYFVKSQSNMK